MTCCRRAVLGLSCFIVPAETEGISFGAVERTKRAEERFLGAVLRILLVAGDGPEHAHEVGMVAANEALERGAIARECPPDALGVLAVDIRGRGPL